MWAYLPAQRCLSDRTCCGGRPGQRKKGMFVNSRLLSTKAPVQSMSHIGTKSCACTKGTPGRAGQQDYLPVYSCCKSFQRVEHALLMLTMSKFASDLAQKLLQNVRGFLHNVHLFQRLAQVDSLSGQKREENTKKVTTPQLQPDAVARDSQICSGE